MPSLPQRVLTSLTLALVCGAPLVACGDDPAAETRRPAATASSGPASTSSPSGAVTPAPEPSDSPPATSTDRDRTPSAGPGGSGTPVAQPPARRATGTASLTAHLLDGDRMPVVRADAWTTVSDPSPDQRPAGACQRFSLETIGAVAAVRREYLADRGDRVRAIQVVARFADRKSAWRASEVLSSWRADCAEHLDPRRVELGPMEPVPVAAGVAASYSADHSPRASERVTATRFGLVRAGEYLSVVELVAAPGDWPQHRDPARVALRRISRTFA